MKILLVYKKSLLDFYKNDDKHLAKIRKDRKMCSCVRKSHEQIAFSISAVEKALKAKGLKYSKLYRGNIRSSYSADLVICVGGDGTLLNAAHFLRSGLLLLVNSDPEQSEAFYSCCDSQSFRQALDNYISGSKDILILHPLRAVLDNKVLAERPLNDILVAHENPAAVTRYLIRAGKKNEEQKSSGIWISPPGGSTAAVKSAGGNRIPLTSMRFQFVVRELYHGRNDPGSGRIRKGMIQYPDELVVKSRTRRGRIFLDGHHISYDFGLLSTLRISLDSKPLKIFGRKSILQRQRRY